MIEIKKDDVRKKLDENFDKNNCCKQLTTLKLAK